MKTIKTLLLVLTLTGALAAHASPALDLAKQLNQAFIEVADKVSPSVVVINVVQKAPSFSSEGLGDPWGLLPKEFRRRFQQQSPEEPQEKSRGQGSGVIIRKNGFILTNRHVVEDAERVEVLLKDGRRFRATIRGVDAQSDLAVLKIEADNLPAATLVDSTQTRVGEFAIAIGAPFALDYSVTFGHVSAKGRHAIGGSEGAAMDQDFIQTDANINPGNSGGPLVNINGEVIGINTLIHGLRTGIGFAIPSSLAREVSDKLITDGKLTRARLGIGIVGIREFSDFQELNPGVRDGVIVRSIDPAGPAANSELRPADVITAVDGHAVTTAQELKNEIRNKTIGKPVTLDVNRNGNALKLAVKPGPWNDGNGESQTRPVVAREGDEPNRLGLAVQPLTPALAEQFGVTANTPGVLVTSVERGGLAARAGIAPGDIITEVARQPVTNPREFRAAVQQADAKKGVLLNLISGKTSRFEILKDGNE